MVSLDHGSPLFNESVLERSYSSSVDYGKNALKKKLEEQLNKKIWEVNIKISRYTPRKPEEFIITPEVSPSTKITLDKICLELDVIHVTRKDTMLENVSVA